MTTQSIESFFEGYAAASLRGDAKVVADHYAGEFIVSGRERSAAYRKDESFLAWLRGVFERNRAIGMASLEVASIHEHRIDDHHAVVTVEWSATFEKTGEERIHFSISYLLRLAERMPLILAYVTHEDEGELMKAKGLA